MPGRKQIDKWLKASLALWGEAGQCPDTGCFIECLDQKGEPRFDLDRRVRVQFRQMYVFSHAHMLGLDPRGVERSRRAFDYVLAHAWAADGEPGWAHLLSSEGEAVDPRRDAYDHAFALFGLSWYYRASNDARALLSIRQTLDVLENILRAPNGGFLESDLGCWPRRQNPHMHAFEACMSLFEATGEHSYLARAGEHYTLFSTQFFDAENAVLLEYFDVDWRPLECHEGQRVEPGHMAEWVWLLREYQRLTGKPLDHQADALFDRMLEIGFDRSERFLIDELKVDGLAATPTRRLWPQTELLKAALAQHRARGCAMSRHLAESTVAGIFDEYLDCGLEGAWRDKFDQNDQPCGALVPASTFYHIFNAFAAAREILVDADAPKVAVERTRMQAHGRRIDNAMTA